MTSQNPIFIPGPTNIPEEMRKAVDMPTIDHRSLKVRVPPSQADDAGIRQRDPERGA